MTGASRSRRDFRTLLRLTIFLDLASNAPTISKVNRMLPPSVFNKMAVDADMAISHGLAGRAKFSVKSPRTEPGLVASFVLFALPEMARKWRALLAPHNLAIELSGVFTHKSPEVRFDGLVKTGAVCELADLLVVVDDRRVKLRRAALIQAKMASSRGTVCITRPGDRIQLDLFQNWHAFSFEEPIYALRSLDLNANGVVPGSGYYGVIDRHWNNSSFPSWKQMSPSSVPGTVGQNPSLGRFIVSMIQGGSGRDATPSPTSDDWVKVVDALMTVTYHKPFRETPSLGPIPYPRGNSVMAFLSGEELLRLAVRSDGLLTAETEPEILLVDEATQTRAISLVHVEITG